MGVETLFEPGFVFSDHQYRRRWELHGSVSGLVNQYDEQLITD